MYCQLGAIAYGKIFRGSWSYRRSRYGVHAILGVTRCRVAKPNAVRKKFAKSSILWSAWPVIPERMSYTVRKAPKRPIGVAERESRVPGGTPGGSNFQ